MKQLSLPASIIIASIITGGIYYLTQFQKNASIERQQESKIEMEEREIEYKQQTQERENDTQQINDAINETKRNECLVLVTEYSKKTNELNQQCGDRCKQYSNPTQSGACYAGCTELIEESTARINAEKSDCYNRFPDII